MHYFPDIKKNFDWLFSSRYCDRAQNLLDQPQTMYPGTQECSKFIQIGSLLVELLVN